MALNNSTLKYLFILCLYFQDSLPCHNQVLMLGSKFETQEQIQSTFLVSHHPRIKDVLVVFSLYSVCSSQYGSHQLTELSEFRLIENFTSYSVSSQCPNGACDYQVAQGIYRIHPSHPRSLPWTVLPQRWERVNRHSDNSIPSSAYRSTSVKPLGCKYSTHLTDFQLIIIVYIILIPAHAAHDDPNIANSLNMMSNLPLRFCSCSTPSYRSFSEL